MRYTLLAGLFCTSLLFCFSATARGDSAKGEIIRTLVDEAEQAIDLSTLGEDFPLTLKAPAGAEAKLDIGDVSVKKGDNFQLHISTTKSDIAALKKEITANTMNKLKQFHTETDDVLLYETEVFGNAEFHFVANIKVGEKVYSCEDEKGPRFTKEDAEAMLKAAKSLAAKQ